MPVKRRTLPVQSEINMPAPLQFPGQRLLTISQAAKYLATSSWMVRDLLRRGAVPTVRIGKRINVDISDLDRYISSIKTKAA
jgi:excisionase family DNA binding protein